MEKNNELTEITEAILGTENGQEQEPEGKGQIEQAVGTGQAIITGGSGWDNEPGSPKEIELTKWAEEAEKIRKANRAKQEQEAKAAGQADGEVEALVAGELEQPEGTKEGQYPEGIPETEREQQIEYRQETEKGQQIEDGQETEKGQQIEKENERVQEKRQQTVKVQETEKKQEIKIEREKAVSLNQKESAQQPKKGKAAISFKERDRMITASQEAVMLFLTIVISAVASFLYGQTAVYMAGIAILAGMGFCSAMFCISLSSENGSFLFDNEGNIWRFTITYLIFLGASIALPLFPPGAWPYPVIFVGLMLFSNQLIGLSAGATLLLITSMIHGDMGAFFIYFTSGIVGIVVFSYANQVAHVRLPLMITMLAHMVCLSVQGLLFSDEPFSMELFLLPAVNLAASFFLMLVLLKFSALCRDWNRYMDINDPESPLLAQLKEISGEDYFHAIHTAYLCERVVRELFLDSRVVKACGFYHRIGLLKGENNWGNIQYILKKNHFPREVRLILREYTDREKRQMIISKEAVALLFCDDVITTISRSFSEKKDGKPDCQKIINAVFIKQLESGMIDDSSISIGELQQIKKALMEEEAYYDLLR